MSAKDYQICPALSSIYIAKVSKRHPDLMLEDRRPLEQHEILGIIEWYVRDYCLRNKVKKIGVTKYGKEIYSIEISGELLEEVRNKIKEEEQ